VHSSKCLPHNTNRDGRHFECAIPLIFYRARRIKLDVGFFEKQSAKQDLPPCHNCLKTLSALATGLAFARRAAAPSYCQQKWKKREKVCSCLGILQSGCTIRDRISDSRHADGLAIDLQCLEESATGRRAGFGSPAFSREPYVLAREIEKKIPCEVKHRVPKISQQ
jgi:hypothetical protein